MSIGSRIKEARLSQQLTQGELAEKVGVTKSAVANYENQVSVPKLEILIGLMSVLNCDANYFYQDELPLTPPEVTPEELKQIKRYRSLDEHGKEVIDFLLRKEFERCQCHTAVPFPQPEEQDHENWKQFVGMQIAARGGLKVTDETEARWLARVYENLAKPEPGAEKKDDRED